MEIAKLKWFAPILKMSHLKKKCHSSFKPSSLTEILNAPWMVK